MRQLDNVGKGLINTATFSTQDTFIFSFDPIISTVKIWFSSAYRMTFIVLNGFFWTSQHLSQTHLSSFCVCTLILSTVPQSHYSFQYCSSHVSLFKCCSLWFLSHASRPSWDANLSPGSSCPSLPWLVVYGLGFTGPLKLYLCHYHSSYPFPNCIMDGCRTFSLFLCLCLSLSVSFFLSQFTGKFFEGRKH